MTRENRLFDSDRPLPYLVRLVHIKTERTESEQQTLLHLDLRGGEFSRVSSARLARVFDWLVRAHGIRQNDVVDYCLELTRLDPEQDFPGPDSTPGQPRTAWRDRWKDQTFHWIPVPYDEDETRYAWQR